MSLTSLRLYCIDARDAFCCASVCSCLCAYIMQSAHGICLVIQAKDAKVFMVVRALDTHTHQWTVINPNGALPPQRGGHSVSPSCNRLCSRSPAAVWELYLYTYAYPFACTLYAWTFSACTLCLCTLCACLASLLLRTGWLACCFLVCLLGHLIIPAPVTDTKRTITSQLRLVHLPTIKVTMTALSALVICHAGHSCG